MKIKNFYAITLLICLSACTADKSLDRNNFPANIEVDGPLSVDTSDQGYPDLPLETYQLSIADVKDSMYIQTTDHHRFYKATSYLAVKVFNPDSNYIASGVSEIYADSTMKLLPGKAYTFDFFFEAHRFYSRYVVHRLYILEFFRLKINEICKCIEFDVRAKSRTVVSQLVVSHGHTLTYDLRRTDLLL